MKCLLNMLFQNSEGNLGNQSKYAYVARKWEFNDAVKGQTATSIVTSINTSDQLENGMYVLEEFNIQENKEIIGDSTTVRTVLNKESRQKNLNLST